jgi:hypothetical protein
VSEPGESFAPLPERVAAFDNDGTLWCEKPLYVQAEFVFRRWKQMLDEDPGRPQSSRGRRSPKGTRTADLLAEDGRRRVAVLSQLRRLSQPLPRRRPALKRRRRR